MSSPTPLLALELQPSRLARAGLLLLQLLALAAAAVSGRPWWQLLLLLPVFTVLLTLAGFRMRRTACVWLGLQADAQGDLQLSAAFADGTRHAAPYAGHARLGTLAIFLFMQRRGWRRLGGPRRIVVLRDATDADSFRRLRARLATV